MQLNELTTSHGITRARRIGRGGKRGKTSGRGHKGQKSRAGHKIRPVERDLIKRIPKRRGYGKNRARTVNDSPTPVVVVNLSVLERVFDANDRVDPKTLVAHGVISRSAGRAPSVKILAMGSLSKKLVIAGCTLSAAARAAVEAAGGEVVV